MIHRFSTCLYIVTVNGTSCTESVFTKPLLAYFSLFHRAFRFTKFYLYQRMHLFLTIKEGTCYV